MTTGNEVAVPESMVQEAAPDQAAHSGESGHHERPHLRAVLRHLGVNLLWANIIPAALFYASFRLGHLW